MSAYASSSLSAVGSATPIKVSPPQNMLWQAAPAYALGLIVTVSSGGSLTYSVQVTADQIPSATGNWNDHDILTGLTASANSNIAYPVTGVRLKVTAYTSGSVNLGVAQWP